MKCGECQGKINGKPICSSCWAAEAERAVEHIRGWVERQRLLGFLSNDQAAAFLEALEKAEAAA